MDEEVVCGLNVDLVAIHDSRREVVDVLRDDGVSPADDRGRQNMSVVAHFGEGAFQALVG